jgi:diguanylate cyclase (GGDEF)-like protein/PAS domain S-box-containing protein
VTARAALGGQPTEARSGPEDLRERLAQLEEENRRLRLEVVERETLEGALRSSEADWQQLVAAMPQIVWIARPDGSVTHVNQQWVDCTGLALEEALGDGWLSALHPDDRDRAATRWAGATRTGEPFEIEYRLRRVDGGARWMLGRARPVRDAHGSIVKWFGTCTDVEDLKAAQARIAERARELETRATQDPLTGLPNRTLLLDRLELLLGQRHRTGTAVAFIDLDDFKATNDTLGHRTGDRVLVHVGEQLQASVRHGDVAARLGGDEFVVVGEAGDERAALALGERLASALGGEVDVDGTAVPISASVGVTFVGEEDHSRAEEVLSRADAVMYEVKRQAPGSAGLEDHPVPAA